MKKIIGLLLSACMVFSMSTGVMAYSDVKESDYASEAIAVLSNLGVINGFEDGTVKPNQLITRAEAATLVVNALNMKAEAENAKGFSSFNDVNTQANWAAGYINVGVAQGFISGMGDGTFAPNNNVTYAQMCSMLTSVTGYGDYAAANGGWPNGYTNIAAQIGLNEKVAANTDTELTRAQVFQMVYNALTTPMLGVHEYNIMNGNTYTQLDGKNGRDFKTLLSDKFDGYVATITITATPISSSDLENDEVEYIVTKADYLPEDLPTKTYFTENVNVNDNNLQTGKAVLVINEDDELVLMYFAPNGRTETKELSADDYVKQIKLAESNRFETNGKIRFGSSYYKIADNAVIYVNGATYDSNVTNDLLDKVIGGAQGTVKLVKDANSNVYNAIFVNYYQIAKVASVEIERNETIISLSGVKQLLDEAYDYDEIVITEDAIEDNETVVNITKNGYEIEISDLRRGDIIAYAINFSEETDLVDPKNITIIATDDVISGTVTKIDRDEDEYTIGGKIYTLLENVNLNLKDSIDAILDPFGRIYTTEVNATSDKYAIVLKVNDDDDTVTMLLPDGEVVIYTNESDFDIDNDADLKDRIVNYTIRNSTKTITNIELANVTESDLEYKSRTEKLGNHNITASTNVINATKVENGNDAKRAGNYSTFDVDNFVNGTTYGVLAIKTGTYTNLIVLTSIGTILGEDSRFALALKDPVPHYTDDNDECWLVEAYYNGDKVELLFAEDDKVAQGDLFFFEVDADGFVDKVYKTNNTTAFAGAIDTEEWSFDITNDDASVILATGVIVDVDDNTISFAKSEATTIDINNDLKDSEDGIIVYAFADDYVSYVYDVNADYVKYEDKVRVRTPKASSIDKYDEDNDGKYVDIEPDDLVEATVMIVDGDVVAIYSIVK